MLTRHPKIRRTRRGAAGAALRIAPAALTPLRCHLTLPAIPKTIPAQWEHRTTEAATLALAHQLVDVGLLHRHHLNGRPALEAMQHALAEFATTHRPRPLATNLGVSLADDVSDMHIDLDRYFDTRDRKLKISDKGSQIHGLFLTFQYEDGMQDVVLGHLLQTVEAAWPRIGQSVLHALESGLMHGCRCISPRTGIDWAMQNYWQGEEDETNYMRDELHGQGDYNSKWTDEQVRQKFNELGYECFKRSDYDADFPKPWQNVKELKQLPDQLPAPQAAPIISHGTPLMQVLTGEQPPKRRRRVQLPRGAEGLTDPLLLDEFRLRWPEVLHYLKRIRQLLKTDTQMDNSLCEAGTWDNPAFMLRFHNEDCLPRIVDDTWNMYYQSGESDMAANGIYFWHDTETLQLAFDRLRNTLAVTQACEDLLHLLSLFPQRNSPEQHRIRIQT